MTKNLFLVLLNACLLSGGMMLAQPDGNHNAKDLSCRHKRHKKSCCPKTCKWEKARCEDCSNCVRGTAALAGIGERIEDSGSLAFAVELERIAGCGFVARNGRLEIRLLNAINDGPITNVTVACGCLHVELRLIFDVRYNCDKCYDPTVVTGYRSDLRLPNIFGIHVLSSSTHASHVRDYGFTFQSVTVLEIPLINGNPSEELLMENARRHFGEIGFDFVAQCTKHCKQDHRRRDHRN